jgi:uncharacterized protein (TIGR02145 family)
MTTLISNAQSKKHRSNQLIMERDSLVALVSRLKETEKVMIDSLNNIRQILTNQNILIGKLRSQVKDSEIFNFNGVNWSPYNLDVITFRNGDTIMQAQSVELWEKAGFAKQPAWCYYQKEDGSIDSSAGKLYNRYAVLDPRGLAPHGWEIASYYEWSNLSSYLFNSDYYFHDLLGVTKFHSNPLNFNFRLTGWRDVGFGGYGNTVTFWMYTDPYNEQGTTRTVSLDAKDESGNTHTYIYEGGSEVFRYGETSWIMGHFVRCVLK